MFVLVVRNVERLVSFLIVCHIFLTVAQTPFSKQSLFLVSSHRQSQTELIFLPPSLSLSLSLSLALFPIHKVLFLYASNEYHSHSGSQPMVIKEGIATVALDEFIQKLVHLHSNRKDSNLRMHMNPFTNGHLHKKDTSSSTFFLLQVSERHHIYSTSSPQIWCGIRSFFFKWSKVGLNSGFDGIFLSFKFHRYQSNLHISWGLLHPFITPVIRKHWKVQLLPSQLGL